MHDDYINHIDLNLLKSLDSLLQTSSVSKAAALTGLSQPAMSRALNRLQQVMKDPLLVRSGRGMVLTPRAEALRQPVQQAVGHVAGIFSPQVFYPSTARDHFRIMGPDYLAQLVMPEVLSRAFSQAPDISIDLINLSDTGIQDLVNGNMSLAFGVLDDGPTLQNVAAQALMHDEQVCLMRRAHPLSSDHALTLETYAEASHAILSITGKGGGRIDDLLANEGLSRRIALRVTHYLTISPVLAATNLIITVPENLAKQVMTDELVQRPLPPKLRHPRFTISQIWHEKFTQDPAHQWLRRIVKSVCEALLVNEGHP